MQIYQKNLEAVKNARLIIAEVSRPSTGTGFELGVALEMGKRTVCLASKDADVTSMVHGAQHHGLMKLIRYSDEADALAQPEALLREEAGRAICPNK